MLSTGLHFASESTTPCCGVAPSPALCAAGSYMVARPILCRHALV